MTGIRELGRASAISPAPEHVWVSVLDGRTQLDVALPLDIPVATLVPELVRLVCSRDLEAPTDTPWPAARHTFSVLSRLDPTTPLPPNQTLRAAGVSDGELLHLKEHHAPSAPTLYDDVVDAAARLNKAAYAGWNATAARWMSFGGMGVTSLVWVYILIMGAAPVITVGLAAATVAAMVGAAALAKRWYGHADVGAVVGWSAIPISAVIVWTLAAPFGGYGVACGCALLVVLNAASYWAIGTGCWGYLASGVFFVAGGLAVLGHAFGIDARTIGVVLAVTAALACPTVSRLTGRLARVEPSAAKPDPDESAVVLENPFTPAPSSTDARAANSSAAAMPTAELVWARVHSAMLTVSALYAGLAVSVLCGAATVLRAQSPVHCAVLVFAGICAAALGVHARVVDSALQRVSLGVPAAALVVAGCVSAQGASAAMAWAGLATPLAVALVASVTGLRVAGRNRSRRWATASAYLHYATCGALIPVALWALGVYMELKIR